MCLLFPSFGGFYGELLDFYSSGSFGKLHFSSNFVLTDQAIELHMETINNGILSVPEEQNRGPPVFFF